MLSPFALTIFYSVCGLIVAFLVFRIWRKSRIPKPANRAYESPASMRAVPEIPPVKASVRQTEAAAIREVK